MPDKRYIFIFCIVILLTFIIAQTLGAGWELASFDYRLRAAGSVENLSNEMVIFGIDDEALNKFGQWPWARAAHAKIVDKLSLLGVKTIAYDILFDNPDMRGAQNDKVFAQSVKKSNIVILPFKFINEGNITGGKVVFPVAVLKNSAAGLGFVDMGHDIDGVARRAALAYILDGTVYPSMGLAVFAFISGVAPRDIKYLDCKIVVGDTVIPTDKNYVVYINFAGSKIAKTGKSDAFEAASIVKIFEVDDKKDTVYKSKICFIGATAEGLKDYFTTPAGYISGVAAHANILNMLLAKKFIVKAPAAYEIFAWFLLGVIGLFILPRFKFWGGFILFLGSCAVYMTVNFILFRNGYYMTFVSPVMFLFLIFTFVQGYQFLRTRRLFGQFVAEELVDQMLDAESRQKLGGEEKEVSVLFSDIRGYTDLSEKMHAKDIMELLNEYHSRMSAIFALNKGRIFDYQGDAQMVVFGAPVEDADHAYSAVKSALAMRGEIEKLKKEWKSSVPLEFNVGIGICTGTVAIGLVGSKEHKQYAAIGNTTNVASRLQGLSKQLGCNVLVTESTYEKIKDKVTVKVFENISIKGKAEPMTVYGIIDLK